jgi:hypothetical protein
MPVNKEEKRRIIDLHFDQYSLDSLLNSLSLPTVADLRVSLNDFVTGV